jgi:uncharacterized membrane protein
LKRQPIYVETQIDAGIEQVWAYTQTPGIHQEWDLRFNTIEYLPRADEEAPQDFLYATRIGFGIKVSGKGRSVGTHSKETGERTSALKFWSDEKISLIRTGSGYWKYIPAGNGVKFLTWYDYETRYGAAGNLVDKFAFRPLIGWATAWSFDALRLWLERGTSARLSKALYAVYAVANFVIALTWIYHGLIPKILHMETGELAMMQASPFSLLQGHEAAAVYVVGAAEILFGLCFIFFGRRRLVHYLNISALLALAIAAAFIQPSLYQYPFNPATTSFGITALSIIVLKIRDDVPNARACSRKPKSQH